MIALASILYGSVMAFTQTNVRLIAGYSSVAQLGFITLGIFSLRPDGADGAVLQMVNHGLVVAPLMLIVAPAGRADRDRRHHQDGRPGDAGAGARGALPDRRRWPLLAMPGSANFVGEFYILNGVFQSKIVFAFVAAIGVALAAYYALRLFQHAMHNRKPRGSRVARDRLARGRRGRRPGRLHRRARPLPAADPARGADALGERDRSRPTVSSPPRRREVAER